MYAAGVTDLISVSRPGASIAPNSTLEASQMGKAPATLVPAGYVHFRGWRQHETTREDVTRWVAEGSNVGLRADHYPAVDIDVLDADLALWIEEQAWQELGYAPVRIGKAPKRALVYRTEEPFGKRSLAFERDGVHHLIEILGSGQQYLVYGRHPSGSDYTFVTDPLEQPLTAITAQQVDTFLAGMGEALTAQGWKITSHQHSVGANIVREKGELLAPSPELLREVMSALPNDDDWHTFQNVGYAIAGAAADDQEGRALFHAWAQKSSRYDAAATDLLWRKLEPRHAGWKQLAARCDQANVHVPALDAYRGEQAADVFGVVRAPDRGERLASLVSDAALVLLFEVAGVGDGQLQARFMELHAAAQKKDVLQAKMDEAMAALSQRSLRFTSHSRFNLLARAILREVLDKVPTFEAELVRDACFIALAPANMLASTLLANCTPVHELPANQDELVRGIPERGLASLIAQPGSGKSFVALELASRIASTPPVQSEMDELVGEYPAQRFGGSPVRHGSVLYFASEDEFGMMERLLRWRDRHGDAQHMHLFRGVPQLTDPTSAIGTVLQALEDVSPDEPPVRLIVIDVYRAAIAGDEDSSETAQLAMETSKLLGRMVGCAVLLVHHTPKGKDDDPRGSGHFLASMDYCAVVQQDGSTILLKEKKYKHGAKAEQPVKWHIAEPGVLVDGPAADATASGLVEQRMHAILALLQQVGPQTPAGMWEMLEAEKGIWSTKKVFYTALTAAHKRGYIEKRGARFVPMHNLQATPETL
jgi:hypothetical protein